MTHWRVPRQLRLDPGDVIPDNWSTDKVLLAHDSLLGFITAIHDNYENQIDPDLQNNNNDSSSEQTARSRQRPSQSPSNAKKGMKP